MKHGRPVPGLPLPPPAGRRRALLPGGRRALGATVDELVRRCHGAAVRTPSTRPRRSLVGVLVPHAGLVYSGVVAATAWRHSCERPARPRTRQHRHGARRPRRRQPRLRPRRGRRSPWSSSGRTTARPGSTASAAWDGGPWRTPLGEVEHRPASSPARSWTWAAVRRRTCAATRASTPSRSSCHSCGRSRRTPGSSPSRSAREPARGRSRRASGSAGSWPPGGPPARTWPGDQLGHGPLPGRGCRRAGDGSPAAVDHEPRPGRAHSRRGRNRGANPASRAACAGSRPRSSGWLRCGRWAPLRGCRWQPLRRPMPAATHAARSAICRSGSRPEPGPERAPRRSPPPAAGRRRTRDDRGEGG